MGLAQAGDPALRLHPERTFGPMKKFLMAVGVVSVLATGCTTTTTRSTQLAEGVALLDIEPVKARCVVDTTQTLQAISQTRTVLGFFRSGDREFAQYPGMVFRLGPAMRERRAAVHKALKGTDFDVMVNPSGAGHHRMRRISSQLMLDLAVYFGGRPQLPTCFDSPCPLFLL